MSQLAINLTSAFAISIIITIMSRLKSQKAKALLYSLPFPITIALIGSKAVATSLSLSGLVLTAGFLWACYLLYGRRKFPILYVDVLLSTLYVGVGYLLARFLYISFWLMLTIYMLGWLTLMVRFRHLSFQYINEKPAKTNIWLKAVIIFAIAFGLFTARQYLAAFVVTFPYNGVFAVYENKFGLYPQAALFTRNSLALVAYFIANYLVGHHLTAFVRYTFSWVAFGIILLLVNLCIKIKVERV
jgi:hypothetical protein